jgi:hypothetical protein
LLGTTTGKSFGNTKSGRFGFKKKDWRAL